MALIKCTECGNMVSEHAVKCPQCGCPISTRLEVVEHERENTSNAITFENAIQLIENGDIEKGIFILSKLTEKGDVKAIYTLGNMYFLGQCVSRDYNRAFQIFIKGSKLNDPDCDYRISQCYNNGLGVIADQGKAKDYFTKALNNGSQLAKQEQSEQNTHNVFGILLIIFGALWVLLSIIVNF